MGAIKPCTTKGNMSTQTTQDTRPCKVLFTRTFTRGNLIGLTHRDSIKHVSRERAEAWLAGVNANSEAGRLDYRITEHVIVNQ
jgi:hypothetical protein